MEEGPRRNDGRTGRKGMQKEGCDVAYTWFMPVMREVDEDLVGPWERTRTGDGVRDGVGLCRGSHL